MPSTQINASGDVFSATISGDEISLSNQNPQSQVQSFDLCDIVIERSGSVDFLQEGYQNGMSIGSISFAAEENMFFYELEQLGLTDPVENKLTLDYVLTYIESNFDICSLDQDKDGIISVQDVKSIYDLYVNTTNSQYDIDNSGLVTENDRQLALQYVSTVCEPVDEPPPVPQPVLHLDCLTYEFGDEVWEDQSDNEYHFSRVAGGSSELPIKNEDGSITLGFGQITSEDDTDARRRFVRTCVVYPPGTDFARIGGNGEDRNIRPNIVAGTADADAAYRELYVPDIDQAFSFEFVYRFTAGISHGQNVGGIFDGFDNNVETGSQNRRCKIFGYPSYGFGGFNFGTGYGDVAQATNPDQFIPYFSHEVNIYGGKGAGTQPGTWDGETGYPHPSEYPNTLPYSKLSNSQYNGYGSTAPVSLNLDPEFGVPLGPEKFYVTVTFDPYSVPGKGSKIYVNGEIITEANAIGVGMPAFTQEFIIGTNMQGGWASPQGVDVFCLKAYDVALTESEVQNKYQGLLNKYGG